jgi:methyl-accepting chemotaxis protein
LDILTDIDKEKRKIKSKRYIIPAAIIFLIIAAFAAAEYYAVSTLLSYKQERDDKSTALITQSKQTMNQTALAITKSANEIEKRLYLISKGQDYQKLLNEDNSEAIENILKEFKDYKDTYSEVETIFLGTADKKMYLYPVLELPGDYDPTSRPWYTNALKNMEFTWSEPYIDVSKGNAIITLSLPVYNEDEVIGVLSADLNLNLILEEVKDVKLGINGYMIITDQNGTIMIHPNGEQIGHPLLIEGLRDLVSKEELGIVKYSYQDVTKMAIYSKIDKMKLNLIGFIEEN